MKHSYGQRSPSIWDAVLVLRLSGFFSRSEIRHLIPLFGPLLGLQADAIARVSQPAEFDFRSPVIYSRERSPMNPSVIFHCPSISDIAIMAGGK